MSDKDKQVVEELLKAEQERGINWPEDRLEDWNRLLSDQEPEDEDQ